MHSPDSAEKALKRVLSERFEQLKPAEQARIRWEWEVDGGPAVSVMLANPNVALPNGLAIAIRDAVDADDLFDSAWEYG